MELIYIWIEKFRNINQTGYNISNDFEVNFNESAVNGLEIKKKQNKTSIFNKKISNVTAFIGINGSGKTNILDLLGVRRDDRLNLERDAKYFLIYHLEDENFVIEGKGKELISSLIKKFPNGTALGEFVSEPYSIIIERKKGIITYKRFLDEKNIHHQSSNYISFRYSYDPFTYKSFRSFLIEHESTVFFRRLNLNKRNTGYQAIYSMLLDLNKTEYVEKKSNSLNGHFKYNAVVDFEIKTNIMINDELKLPIKKFDPKFISFTSKWNEIGQFSKLEIKKYFINNFLYDFTSSLAAHLTSLSPVIEERFINDFSEFEKKLENEIELEAETYYKNLISFMLNNMKIHNKYIDINVVNDFFEGYLYFLKSMQAEFFERDKLSIPLNLVSAYDDIMQFLKLLDRVEIYYTEEMHSILNVFKLSFNPLSSGESALLSLFSALYFGAILPNKVKDKLIILLDEPEQYLHPEWCRVLLNGLMEFLNSINDGYKSYQIIFTTHSPFLISDLPSKNVIPVTKGNDGKGLLVNSNQLGDTFAANIHTLLANEFFMKSTIGEFAKKKINEVISFLNDDQNKNSFSREYIDYLISIIGEPIIKRKLEMMRDKKYLSIKERDEKIAFLRSQIKELEEYDSNSDSE